MSKQGRVWTFSFNAPSDFTVLLPKNSAIVGMTNLPINMEIDNDRDRLTLASGDTEIDYLFGATPIIPNGNNPSTITPTPTFTFDYLAYAIIIGVIAAVIVITIVALTLIRTKRKTVKSIKEETQSPPIQATITAPKEKEKEEKGIDIETILKLKSDIREDDKEIVKFIFDKGGHVFESELRKKFLQPRTTMWRAVKRLERNNIIEIQKKDLQNLVKLRKDIMEDEEE